MNWKKTLLRLLYPRLIVIICLLPISVIFLIFSLTHLSATSMIAIISYLLAFYLLIVISLKMPKIISNIKKFKSENKYAKKYFSDVHLRIRISLYSSVIWNFAFAIFQLGLAIHYNSFWFYSLFIYYVVLGIIRFFLVKHTKKYKVNEQEKLELKKYVNTGWLLLFINYALTIIVFFMVYYNRTFYHHMITSIAMAFYTFLTFTFSIINSIRYKKYKSPVYSATKNISLISGAVSMLTLETTMLTTFGRDTSPLFNQVILSLTGFAVITFAIIMAINMIIKGNKKLKTIKTIDKEKLL